jgi:hypothetical protein
MVEFIEGQRKAITLYEENNKELTTPVVKYKKVIDPDYSIFEE